MPNSPANSKPKRTKVSHIDTQGRNRGQVVGPGQDMDDPGRLKA